MLMTKCISRLDKGLNLFRLFFFKYDVWSNFIAFLCNFYASFSISPHFSSYQEWMRVTPMDYLFFYDSTLSAAVYGYRSCALLSNILWIWSDEPIVIVFYIICNFVCYHMTPNNHGGSLANLLFNKLPDKILSVLQRGNGPTRATVILFVLLIWKLWLTRKERAVPLFFFLKIQDDW